jgi:hypothetical protein
VLNGSGAPYPAAHIILSRAGGFMRILISVISLFWSLNRSDESPKARRLSFKTAFADFTNSAERHDSHAASYAPAAVWRAIQSCLNDSNVENTCLHRRRPQMSKLEMLTPQNSAIAMIDYQPAMY